MVDGHSANLLADGLTCLSLKVGVPARLMINQDSSFMKVLQEGSNDIVDLETDEIQDQYRLPVMPSLRTQLSWPGKGKGQCDPSRTQED